jgi:hypothetical protein
MNNSNTGNECQSTYTIPAVPAALNKVLLHGEIPCTYLGWYLNQDEQFPYAIIITPMGYVQCNKITEIQFLQEVEKK